MPDQPCSRDGALRELTKLRLGCVPQHLSPDELALQTADYAATLTRYPADVVREAVDRWPEEERGAWWPAKGELIALLDRIAARRERDARRTLPPAPRLSRDGAEAQWLRSQAGQMALANRVAHSCLIAWRRDGTHHAPDVAIVRKAIIARADGEDLAGAIRRHPDRYACAPALLRLRAAMSDFEDALTAQHLREEAA